MNEPLVHEYADKSLDNFEALSKLREQIAKTLQDEEDKRSRRRKRHPFRTAFRIFKQTFELKNRKTFVWWTSLSYSLCAAIFSVIVFTLQCASQSLSSQLARERSSLTNISRPLDVVNIYEINVDYWLLFEAFLLLLTGAGSAWLAISNNQLLKREVHMRCRYVLRQIDACLSDPAFETRWSAPHFLDLYCPTTPATTMCWTIRRRLVNMPLNLLVADDVILLRPGQRCAVHCRVLNIDGPVVYRPGQTIVSPSGYVNDSSASSEAPARKTAGSALKCPMARKSVCAIPCVVTETPFVRNLVQVLHRNHQRPSTVIHRQVYWFVHVFLERHLLPCTLLLSALTGVVQLLTFAQLESPLNCVERNSSQLFVTELESRCASVQTRKRYFFTAWCIQAFVQINLSLFSMLIPAAVFLCGLLAVARVLVVFDELKTRVTLNQTSQGNREQSEASRTFGEIRAEDETESDGYSKHIEAFHPESVRLPALLRTLRAVLRFEAQTLPRSANIAYVLGSVTSLCCVDKRGIVSWPIPITERVCFLRRRHEHPVAAAATSVQTQPASASGRGSRVDRTVSMSAAADPVSSGAFVKASTHLNLANANSPSGAANTQASPHAAAETEPRTVRSSSSFAGFDHIGTPQTVPAAPTHSHTRSRATAGPSDTKLCVLDLTQDVTKRFALRFDDANWKRHLRSLKPLGLSTMLNSCNLSTSEQFCRFTDQLSAVAAFSDYEVAVVNRRCLCNLARQFGFTDSCTTAYTVEQLIGLYSHRVMPERERDRTGKRPRQPLSVSAIASPNEERGPNSNTTDKLGLNANAAELSTVAEDVSVAIATASRTDAGHPELETEAELEVHETIPGWKPSKASLVKQAPVPNVFSVIVRDSRTGESHLFAQGTAELLLAFCTDYWDGRNVVPLTAGDRHKILDFYNRNILSAYCIAMAYCPVLEPLLGKFPSDMFIELPTDMSETLADLAKLLDSAKKGDTESLGGADADAHCQHTSTPNSVDIDSFLRVQYGQIFLGMIATQYAVKRDVVDLVDNLERACIRFIYFSKENELRSRVFAERLGLEAGWNCHISLANPARSDKVERDSSDRESGYRAAHERERDVDDRRRDERERERFTSGGSGDRRAADHDEPAPSRSGTATGSTEHCRPLTIAVSGAECHAPTEPTPTTAPAAITSSPTPNWFRDAVPILPADTHEWKPIGDLNRSDSAPALFCAAAIDQQQRVQFAVDDGALPRKNVPYSAERERSTRSGPPDRTRPAEIAHQNDSLLRSAGSQKRSSGMAPSPIKPLTTDASTSRRQRSNESLSAKRERERERDSSQLESYKQRRPSIGVGRQHSSPSPPTTRRGLMRRFRHGSYASSSSSSSSSSNSHSSSSSSSSDSRSRSSSSSSTSTSSGSGSRADRTRTRSGSRSSVSSSSLEPHANSNVYDEDLVAFRRTTVKQKSRTRPSGRRKRTRKRRHRHRRKRDAPRERRRSGRFHRSARQQTSDPSATEPSAVGTELHRVTTPTRNQSRSQSQSLHEERSSQSQSHRGADLQLAAQTPSAEFNTSVRGGMTDIPIADCELGTLSEDEQEHADGDGTASLSDAASTLKLTHRSDEEEDASTTLRSGDAADSDEFSLLAQNIAKLPRGVAQVRTHLERVDNVPLLVNLFTDCTEKAIVEMSTIMQDYNQVVCIFGSSLNADNITAFLQADASIAVHPVYPPVCIRQPPLRPPDSCASSVCASVRESCTHTLLAAASGNGAQRRSRTRTGEHAHTVRPLAPLHLAAVLNSLPCSLASTNSELRIGTMLMSLVCEARNFVCNMRYAYEFHFCVSMSMLIVQLLIACITLHRPFATYHLLWLAVIVRTVLSAALLAKPTDLDMVKRPLKRYQASAKVSKHTIREFCLHSGIRFVPSCIVVALCFVLNLLALCQDCSARLQPESAIRCIAFVWELNQPDSASEQNATLLFLPIDAVRGAQCFAEAQFFMYITIISAGVVYRHSYIWQWIAKRNRSATFLLTVATLLAFQCAITAIEVNALADDWSIALLPSHSFIIAAVWTPLLFGVNELVKRRELRLDLRYQKQIRLEFGTKLGMNSPWA